MSSLLLFTSMVTFLFCFLFPMTYCIPTVDIHPFFWTLLLLSQQLVLRRSCQLQNPIPLSVAEPVLSHCQQASPGSFQNLAPKPTANLASHGLLYSLQLSACFPLSPPTSHRLPSSQQPKESISKNIFIIKLSFLFSL